MTGCAILDGNIAARKNGKRLPCESLQAENAKLRELVYDLLNAWDDIQHEVITGPTFDECERYAYELGIEVD